MSNSYNKSVFVNVPYDKKYKPFMDLIIFAIIDCGYEPRTAKERSDSSEIRIEKIYRLIEESQFGIHDISRTTLDKKTKLPRFNMPLELGIFLGAKHFGKGEQSKKSCLILESEKYLFQKYISDISGQDIEAHDNKIMNLSTIIRNWLNDLDVTKIIPGGKRILNDFQSFTEDMPILARAMKLDSDDLTMQDYIYFISVWLKENQE